jgi:hypothetical protein
VGKQVLPLITCIVVATLVSSYAQADRARVAEIKRLYAGVAAKIRSGAIKASVVKGSRVVPGIGPQTRRVTFYRRADRTLAKVVTYYNVAASAEYTTHYLLDKAGRLAFYYVRSRFSEHCANASFEVKSQERLYLSTDGKLVRYLLERSALGADPAAVKGTKCAGQVFARRRADRGFKKAELDEARRALRKAAWLVGLHATFNKGQARAVRKILGGEDGVNNL